MTGQPLISILDHSKGHSSSRAPMGLAEAFVGTLVEPNFSLCPTLNPLPCYIAVVPEVMP